VRLRIKAHDRFFGEFRKWKSTTEGTEGKKAKKEGGREGGREGGPYML
jgi:hypothetical protein